MTKQLVEASNQPERRSRLGSLWCPARGEADSSASSAPVASVPTASPSESSACVGVAAAIAALPALLLLTRVLEFSCIRRVLYGSIARGGREGKKKTSAERGRRETGRSPSRRAAPKRFLT
eukprot:scaffold49733_cov27-Tisochrysis_lutea.AAC.2